MARAAIYSMISLGVRNIFVCNRTLENANALAEHYNQLIGVGSISELDPSAASQSRIRVLESFASLWPRDVRQPTMIVCCIPTHGPDGSPTNFSVPEAWLLSPNGGVVLEVSFAFMPSQRSTNRNQLAYGQPVSPAVRQVRERVQAGWTFMDGFDVLPEQAYSQFEIFTGRRAPRKLMKDQVLSGR